MKDESLKLVDEIWQKGFAEGKASALNQFIRSECDKLVKKTLSFEDIQKIYKDAFGQIGRAHV